MGVTTAYIMPGSPWENGLKESFNARLRDELVDGEIFYSLAEARIIVESWRRHYNTARPHQSLGYKPPAPEVFIPVMGARSAQQPRPAALIAIALEPVAHYHPTWIRRWGSISWASPLAFCSPFPRQQTCFKSAQCRGWIKYSSTNANSTTADYVTLVHQPDERL